MIYEITPEKQATIRNPVFAAYAGIYERIMRQFEEQVGRLGIPFEKEDQRVERGAKIDGLAEKGVQLRNDRKSLVLNRISPGCEICRKGTGSFTYFVSLKCNRSCFYCFNSNQDQYEFYLAHTRDVVVELQALKKQRQPVRHLALTGGEPLLFKEEALAFFRAAKQWFRGVSTRLYTCGDYADEDTLRDLREAGLDEIRFSIRMPDIENGKRFIYERIDQARQFIPRVMVEMPVLPDRFEEMKGVLDELNQLEIFGINLLELCFPFSNVEEFNRRGYRLKQQPYRVLYNYWYAGGLPVAESEDVCLDLLDYAAEAGLKLGVHYCSLENKHTGQVYQQNQAWTAPRISHFSNRDFFLKTAKVFGDDIQPVTERFNERNYTGYQHNLEHNYLEFHPSRIVLLQGLDVEVGISTNIMENRSGEPFMRELKIELTSSETFAADKDL